MRVENEVRAEDVETHVQEFDDEGVNIHHDAFLFTLIALDRRSLNGLLQDGPEGELHYRHAVELERLNRKHLNA